MLTLPHGTEITQNPNQVEFRLPTANGVRLVRVWLGGEMPRVSALYLRLEHGEVTEHPLSLFLDEILLYVNQALTAAKSNLIASFELAPAGRVSDQSPALGSLISEGHSLSESPNDEDR